jgi:hypothetical protein
MCVCVCVRAFGEEVMWVPTMITLALSQHTHTLLRCEC